MIKYKLNAYYLQKYKSIKNDSKSAVLTLTENFPGVAHSITFGSIKLDEEDINYLLNKYKISELEQKEIEQVIPYKTPRELELAIRSQMPQMLERYPVLGWVRPQSIQSLQDEIDRLKSELAQAKMGKINGEVDPFLSLPRVNMKDSFSFDYRTHAYQDGNFKDLNVIREMSWGELFKVLSSDFVEATPEENFSKVMNQYLNESGLADAQKQMPRTHAISRAQINVRSLHIIKQQMRQNEWIVPVGRDDRQRLLWKVTDKSAMILKNNSLMERHSRII